MAHAVWIQEGLRRKLLLTVFSGYRNLVTNPSYQTKETWPITGSVVAAVRTQLPRLIQSQIVHEPNGNVSDSDLCFDSLPAGLKGQNCETRILYLGDASLDLKPMCHD